MKTKLHILILLLALFASGKVVRSANITWTNTAGGNWNNAQNWDLNQVPGIGDAASIPDGGINVIIDSTNSTGGLSLGGGCSLTITTNGVLNLAGNNSDIKGALTNAGTVNWQGGSVTVYNNGANYLGAIWNAAGAIWAVQCDQLMIPEFGGGLAQFQNAGTVIKSTGSGTTSFDIPFDNSGSVQAQGGTIQFNVSSDLGGSFQASAIGAIYFGGTLTISTTPNFQGPGPVQITGASVLLNNFAGNLTLNGDRISGVIATNGVLNLAGSDNDVTGALTNTGTVNWQGGSVSVYDDGTNYFGAIWNVAGAVWAIQCDQLMISEFNGNLAQFQNAGTVIKSAGSGTTGFSIPFDNSGSVQAQGGTIQFNVSSDLGGSFQASAIGAIYFGGTLTISTTPNFQGPGPVEIINARVLLNNFAGNLTLNGDRISGVIATNGVLNLTGSDNDVRGALTNAGTVNWQGGSVTIYNNGSNFLGAIWNAAGAVWAVQCNQLMIDGYGLNLAQFQNAGTVIKSVGSGITGFNVPFANSGIVQVQGGTFQFNGSYTETLSANQVIGIGGTAPGSGYGQIQFLSPTFAGSFNVNLLNGFRPGPGNNFAVLSYPSFAGNFTSLNGLDLGSGLQLVPQFGNTNLTLVAANYSASATPSLSLYPTANNSLLVSWPLNFTGWQLQTTTNLATPVWTPVTVAGTNNNIVLPMTGPQGFFRLDTN